MRRWLKNRLLFVLAALIVSAALLHLLQFVHRRRAEKLLADISSLELRTATFAEAQAVFHRWEDWGSYQRLYDDESSRTRECTQERCDFIIHFDDYFTRFVRYMDPGFTGWLSWADDFYELLGRRASRVAAKVTVLDGKVWAKWFRVVIDIRETHPIYTFAHRYGLMATSFSIPRFYPGGWAWRERRFHSEYGVDWPTSCKDCEMIDAMFTPYASPADAAKMMDINLSCLTSYISCRYKADIMPAAMAEYGRDQQPFDQNQEKIVCDPKTVELVSRDAENVIIGDVLTFGRDRILNVRIVERVKGGTFWELGTTRSIKVYDDLPSLIPSEMSPGDRVILLLGYRTPPFGHPAQELTLERCGGLLLNDDNLAIVERGISQDDRPNERVWY